MAMRKLEDKNIRKILRSGDSYAVTIPIEIMGELKWKEKQKVVVKRIRGGFSVKDWEK
jgi:antitoxin component of MazEF toxin-antitoxin module